MLYKSCLVLMNKKGKKILIRKDASFFAELYEKYYSGMLLFTEGIVYDSDEAKDIVQDVFTDLWNKPEKVHIHSTIKTFLYTCAKNKAFNRLKKLNIIDRHQEQLAEAYLFSLENQTHSDEKQKQQIQDILNKMPDRMREVLDMHVIQELKYTDIAEKLGISINSVKTHIKRAYKRFREEINLMAILFLLLTVGKLLLVNW